MASIRREIRKMRLAPVAAMLLGMVLNLLSSETIHAWTVGENHATKEMAAVQNQSQSRRKWLKQVSVAVAGSTTVYPARAVQEESAALYYFGVGCFWHVQHELWKAEQQLLGRSVQECTALAGYAGGKKVGKDGTVCYHNFLGQSDYGKLGHSEVVALTIPDQKLESIARAYFDLFVNGERVDPQDAGSEYRSLLGLPGGAQHVQFDSVKAAAKEYGLDLVLGKGNDADTLGKRIVYVMDSTQFPFYQAEVYHQYHNDFQTPPYGKAYNDLADQALDQNKLAITGCPDRVQGTGVGLVTGAFSFLREEPAKAAKTATLYLIVFLLILIGIVWVIKREYGTNTQTAWIPIPVISTDVTSLSESVVQALAQEEDNMSLTFSSFSSTVASSRVSEG